MLLPLVTATAIGATLFGRLIDQYSSKPIIIGILLTMTGFFLMHLVNDSRILFYSAGVLIGFGLSVRYLSILLIFTTLFAL